MIPLLPNKRLLLPMHFKVHHCSRRSLGCATRTSCDLKQQSVGHCDRHIDCRTNLLSATRGIGRYLMLLVLVFSPVFWSTVSAQVVIRERVEVQAPNPEPLAAVQVAVLGCRSSTAALRAEPCRRS